VVVLERRVGVAFERLVVALHHVSLCVPLPRLRANEPTPSASLVLRCTVRWCARALHTTKPPTAPEAPCHRPTPVCAQEG
jgi:hypothetical protein